MLYRQLTAGKSLTQGDLNERLMVSIRGSRPRSVFLSSKNDEGYEHLVILMNQSEIIDLPNSPHVKCATINQKIERSDIYELNFLGDRIATFENKRQYLDGRLPNCNLSFDYQTQARSELGTS